MRLDEIGLPVLVLVNRGVQGDRLYQQEKRQGPEFYRYATFYSCDEVVRLLVGVGFSIENVISILFQQLGEVNHIEVPRERLFSQLVLPSLSARKEK